jgi:anaerobic magnesium-protoporphyrin IX monomethyl ester cyclase
MTPPINLMYAAQSLKENSFKTRIMDALASNTKEEQLLAEIKKQDPELIGFPLYSSDLTMIYELTEKIKKLNENTKIFFAGHHATALYNVVMQQFPNADFLIRGEGEFTVVDLANALEKKKRLNNIKGISYRENKKIVHNPDRPPIEDLDSVPIPSRMLIDDKLYYSRMSKNKKVDILITTRGCPYRCTFCSKLNDRFRGYRERSINNIIEEMKLIEEEKTKGIEIYDEIFTLKRKRVLDLMAEMRKEKFDFEFRVRTRVTHVDGELLHELKKTGCSVISYGVESGNQNVLDNIKKDITLPLVESVFKKTEKEDINILGFFMVGNRGETPETIRDTINFAKKVNPLYAIFSVVQPFPGSIDYEEAKKNHSLVGEYAPYKPMPWLKLPWAKDVGELYQYSNMALDEFYKRPKYLSKFITTTIRQGNWNLLGYTMKNFYKKLTSINPL